MPFRTTLSSISRGFSRSGSVKPPSRRPSAVKICTRGRRSGASATTKLPSAGIDVERGRIEHAAGLRADVDDLLRGVAGDRVDGVGAAVEHEVLAVVGLLESDGSRNAPAMCAGSPPVERSTSTRARQRCGRSAESAQQDRRTTSSA